MKFLIHHDWTVREASWFTWTEQELKAWNAWLAQVVKLATTNKKNKKEKT